MATIETRRGPDGKPAYRARVRLHGHSERTQTFKRKTDAKAWAESVESDLRRGRYVPTGEAMRRTVADMLDKYVRDYLPVKAHNKDRVKTQALLMWWREQIGHYALANVTPSVIAEFRDDLRKGAIRLNKQRSPATVNRYLAAISHAFKIAVQEWHWLEVSPMRGVGRYGESEGRIRYLSDDERERLLRACRNSNDADLYTAVVLALSTGMRQGEIRSLTWDRVDLTRGMIVLEETKTTRRRVPLVSHALALMRSRTVQSRYVFPSPRNREKPRSFRSALENAIREAGLSDFRPHDLRHSAASALAMNGASPSEIAAILGHKTLQMVKRYSHIADEHSAQVVRSMNEQLFGARE
jgi:integrase